MTGEPTTRRLGSRDVVAAALLGLLGAGLARALFQERMLGDGAGLATFFARGDRYAYHFLYLPACRALAPLARALDPADPIEATRICSQAAYGAALGLTFLLARALGLARAAAAFGAALAALAPAALFFGTTVEVHALHHAAAAGAALGVTCLPWRRPALATAGAAALYALVVWAHQTGALLGPGWILLCAAAARAAGRPLGARALVLGVGPALVLALLAGGTLAAWLRTGSLAPAADDEIAIVTGFARPPEAARFLWDGWLRPLALLAPAAIAGAWTAREGRLVPGARAALLALVGVPLAVLTAWGVAEWGGYALGHAPFLACLAACAWPNDAATPRATAARAALVLALIAQGALAVRDVRAAGAGFDVDARARLVARHLEGGTFVATVDNAPALDLYLPGARVLSARDAAIHGAAAGEPPEAIAATLLALARAEVERSGRVLVDLGFETQRERAPIRRMLPVLEPLVAGLEAEFTTSRIEDRWWPLLVVER